MDKLVSDIRVVLRLDDWFYAKLQGLRYKPETLAYVSDVLRTMSKPVEGSDMSKCSVVLAFQDAITNGDFIAFQRIGDWVLWTNIVLPDAVASEREVVQTIARAAYRTCYRLLRGKWHVYQELADELPLLVNNVRERLV